MKTFLASDTHFGHKKIIEFEKDHRPFPTIEEHDEELIKRWNEVVGPEDLVYHLGDVAFGRPALECIARCNGKKIHVMGNHDKLGSKTYLQYFDDVYGVCVIDGYLLTHIPIHPQEKRWWKGNIHGHLHSNRLEDPWYFCVSMEQTNLAPIEFSEVKLLISINQEGVK